MLVGTPLLASASNSNNGWTAGAGLEYAFWGTWSAALNTISSGSTTRLTPCRGQRLMGYLPNDVITSNNRQINLITVGLNYKFGRAW